MKNKLQFPENVEKVSRRDQNNTSQEERSEKKKHISMDDPINSPRAE